MRFDLSVFPRAFGAMACVLALLFVAGCGDSDDASSGGSMDVRIPEDPADLDPHVGVTTSALSVASYMYDTLVGRNADGDIVPQLATDWEVTSTSMTMQIRDDVTCSDGSKITPSVIKANLDRVKDPKTESPWTETFLGSTEYKVTADDGAGTVTLKLPEPFSSLLQKLPTYPAILCQAALDDPSVLQEESVGSGPFVLKEKVADDHYTLTRREGYEWGPDGATTAVDGFPNEVTLRVVANDTTAANQLEGTELDLAPIVGPERERLAQNGSLVSKSIPSAVTFLHFNEAEGRPGADPAMREALVQAIDRDALTVTGYGEFAEPAQSLLLPGSRCYSEAPGESIATYDADAARNVVSGEAPSLKVYAIGAKGGEYLSEAWQQAGATVDVSSDDGTGPGVDVVFGAGDWDATMIQWDGISDVGGLSAYLSGPAPPDGTNIGSIDNPTFVKNVRVFKSDVGDAACAASDEAQAALFAASDVIPISALTKGFFAQEGIEFEPNLGLGDVVPTSLRIVD